MLVEPAQIHLQDAIMRNRHEGTTHDNILGENINRPDREICACTSAIALDYRGRHRVEPMLQSRSTSLPKTLPFHTGDESLKHKLRIHKVFAYQNTGSYTNATLRLHVKVLLYHHTEWSLEPVLSAIQIEHSISSVTMPHQHSPMLLQSDN